MDVTRKSDPELINRINYAGSAYTHQGWPTEDQRHFLLGDELDEFVSRGAIKTTTYIFDLEDLALIEDPTTPTKTQRHAAETEAIDHNLYVKGDMVHQTNYRAGLRILDGRNVDEGQLREVAFFDVYPADDLPEFNGSWSNYPYYSKNVVVVSGIEHGLFVLQPKVR